MESFGGLPVYGWEFFDVAERELAEWGAGLSLDWHAAAGDGRAHSIALFQEGPDRHLDLCVWFDAFAIRDPGGRELTTEEFAAGGRRWWDAFERGDLRTQGLGLIPMK